MLEQQFIVFKEVAETGNITLASKRLFMSQPSISIQIQNLEREYGTRFFDRTNKGVTLTPAGQVFYQHAKEIIELLQDAGMAIADLSENKRWVINVGATLTIGEYVLPTILGHLFQERPDIDFTAKIANTLIIAQDVLEKRIHIGLVEGPVPEDNDLLVEPFGQDELVVIVPEHHVWAKRSSVTLDELAAERMITREWGSGTRKVMELALEEAGLKPDELNITMELGSTQAIKQAVAVGLGVSVISILTVRQESALKQIKTLRVQGCSLVRPLSILTHAKVLQSREEQFFIDFLRGDVQPSTVLNSEDV
jgi:DNA-binding transcriptional LysR family regulator